MAQRFKQVALFLPPTPGYLSDVLNGVIEFARSSGDWVIEVCHTLAIAEATVAWWRPDGVLLNATDGDWAPLIERLGIPTVQVGGQPLGTVPRVVTDNDAIGRLAARHFIDRGFRNFAYLGYGSLAWSCERGRAFCESLEEAGLRCNTYGDDGGIIHASNVQGTLADWVAKLPKPVAVFACHDRAAMLLGRACAWLKLEVPDNVAILGVDNNPVECGLTTPAISSVMGSARRIGYQGSVLLDRMMKGEPVSLDSLRVAPAGVAVRGSSDIYATDDPDLLAAIKYIKQHADEPIEVGDVARAIIVTRRMLERKFRAILNRSPREQILLAHVETAKDLLINTNLSMLEVAIRSGFPSSSKFATVFKREATLAPLAFRRLYGTAEAGVRLPSS